MMKWFASLEDGLNDAALKSILKMNDPVRPPSEFALATLEAGILAQLKTQVKKPTLWAELPVFRYEWGMRAVAFASVFILTSGFVVGQFFSGTVAIPTFLGNVSLVAFTDETASQYLSATDASWGDTDDNVE